MRWSLNYLFRIFEGNRDRGRGLKIIFRKIINLCYVILLILEKTDEMKFKLSFSKRNEFEFFDINFKICDMQN